MNTDVAVAPAPAEPHAFEKILVPCVAAVVLVTGASPGVALLAGALLAITVGNPYAKHVRGWLHPLLAFSVMGLGAGMDLRVVLRAGLHGVGYTAVGIALTLALGAWIGTRLRVPAVTALLVTVGTAICGGSAIAAVAPTVRAKEHETSAALAAVFLLNAVALILFPAIGHALGLTQAQFGLWSALAIHDTSSVVGAASTYGATALQIATSVKLARALWIVPVSLGIGWFWNRGEGKAGRGRRPWFIAGFLAAAALVTWLPALRPTGAIAVTVAHRLLALTLFGTGSLLTRSAMKAAGVRPFAMGLVLWLTMATATLGAIRFGWIG